MAITITSSNTPTTTTTILANSVGPNITVVTPNTSQTGVLEPTNFSGTINMGGGILYADLSPGDYGGAGGTAAVPVSYTLSKSPTSTVNEGNSVTITLTASDGATTPFPYSITGVTSPDFNPSGTPTAGTGSLGSGIPYTFASDATTEGTETMTFSVPSAYPADGTGGSGQSIAVSVGDTSTSPGGGGSSGPYYLPGGTPYTQSPYITNPNSTHSISNTWYRRGIVRFNYPSTELSTAGLSSSKTINSCSWYLNTAPNRPVAPQFTIAMGPTPAPAPTFSSSYYTSTITYGPTPYTWSGSGAKTFNFSTPFTYPGSGGIQMNVTWGQVTPNYNASGTIRLRSPGNQYYRRTDGSGFYPISYSSANQSYNSGRPITQLGV
tara:strand:- start:24442 stop:25578 length:1137 start_codon:yes stop_codon:yes gene_type:complete